MMGDLNTALPSRPRRALRWTWAHRKLTAYSLLLAAFVALNVVAYRHAYAMTHFAPDGVKTGRPETLSFSQKAAVLFSGVSIPRPTSRTTPAAVGLPFEVCRFPAADGAELEAWYVARPRPRGLVVLFHGYAASKSSLLHPARAFHDLGFATLLVDFRGSGGSSGSETTIGVREAADVAAAHDYARTRWGTRLLVLFGTSMGAAAILRAVAIHDLQPDALVLECPFDRLVNTVGRRCSQMGVPAFPVAQLLVFWGGVQCGFNGFTHAPAEYAASVRCPVLLMHGDQDATVSVAQAQAIYDNLPGEKQFEVLPGVRHELFVTASPDRWKKAVRGFLAGRRGE